MRSIACAVLCLALHAEAATHNWVVRKTILSPDGYPRSAIVVVDLNDESLSSPELTEWGTATNAINAKLKYKGRAGQVPGPTLRVRQHEQVVIRVKNELEMSTSIHWHGLHQQLQAWQDGTAGVTGCGIAPGATRTYSFMVTQGPGTHWYHSHVAAQTADGLQGAIVILPAEGKQDPVMSHTPYKRDQELTVMDWSHETSDDLIARYTARIGAFQQTIPKAKIGVTNSITANEHTDANTRSKVDVKESFLPDYPWPSMNVLLNGRGQTECKTLTYADCERIRVVGWPHWLNSSNPPFYTGKSKYERSNSTGLLTGTLGQCVPARPPLDGRCVEDAVPASLRCDAGQATRVRIVNTGYSMPLRVWVDRHQMTVVARDGTPVVPNGPHKVLTIAIGQRIDVVIKCDASPQHNYKIFAQVALYEFYPGAQKINFQASSYAVLSYGQSPSTPVEPEWDPDTAWPSAAAGSASAACAATYRDKYASWGFGLHDFIPTSIELALKPLLKRDRVAAPADGGRAVISTAGDGNWWNDQTKLPQLEGLPYEWWTVNEGPSWTERTGPLTIPEEPILQGRMMGRSLKEIYQGKQLPFVKTMLYDAEKPKTFEIVMINWGGQQHPWHVHGMSLQMIGQGWLDPQHKWSSKAKMPKNKDGKKEFIYHPSAYNFSRVDQHADSIVGDTFTLPARSFWVFRVTADNPGPWLLHCHMDPHLVSGMGFMISVEDKHGKYPIPPPSNDLEICACPEATYGAYKNSIAAPKTDLAELSATAPDHSDEQVHASPHVAVVALMGLVVAPVFVAVGFVIGRFWTPKPNRYNPIGLGQGHEL